MPSAVYVTLSRTGRRFAVERNETILDAALRQQIWLPHACRGGSCGSCRAIVVSGAVATSDDGQTRRPAVSRNEALLCRATASKNVILDVTELAERPSRSGYRIPARVVELQKPSRDVAIIRLRPPPTETVRFRPGQYISLVGDDGRLHPFSIANAPRADGTLELHIGRIPNGRFTEHVLERMRPRDLVRFEGPFGQFGFSAAAASGTVRRPAILLAGGTGIAPIKAMLESLDENATGELHVYWGSRRKQGLYAIEALSGLANGRGARLTPVLSEPAATDGWRGRVGLVHRAAIADFPDLSRFDVYACGSPGLIDAAFRDFTRCAAVPPDRFFADTFHTTATAPPVTSAAEGPPADLQQF